MKTTVMQKELSGQEALFLFKGWFHNKMMIILIMSQYPKLRRSGSGVESQVGFLHDIEHHYLRKGVSEQAFRSAVRWLIRFLRVYPNGVTRERSRQALAMIQRIYDGFGFHMYWDTQKELKK
jgi:hypothetical protein